MKLVLIELIIEFVAKTYKYILFLILIIAVSCSSFKMGAERAHLKKVLPPKEYVLWLKNPQNNLYKVKVAEDITFICLYKPIEYIVCMEEKKDKINSSILQNRKKELGDMFYYEFTIKLTTETGDLLKHKMNSGEDYTSRVKYFAFNIQHDFSLEIEGETVPCSLCHFERVFDTAPYAKFSIGFVRSKKNEGKVTTLIYNDRVFNKGLIKYIYCKEEFNSIPKLETND